MRPKTRAGPMPIFKSFTYVLVVMSMIGFAGCAPVEEEPVTEPSDATVSGPAEVTSPAAAPEPAPSGLTAESLTGTTWAIADYSVTFEADGIVSFNSGSKGTWSLADGTITISAAGEDTVIGIDGDSLTQNGMTLERQ